MLFIDQYYAVHPRSIAKNAFQKSKNRYAERVKGRWKAEKGYFRYAERVKGIFEEIFSL